MRKLVISIAAALAFAALAYFVARSTRLAVSMPEAATIDVASTPAPVRTSKDRATLVPVEATPRADAAVTVETPRSAPVVPSRLIGEELDEPAAAERKPARPKLSRSQVLVTGRVIGATGHPLEGATAALIHTGQQWRRSSRGSDRGASWSMSCDQVGRFQLLAPTQSEGEFELVVEAPDHGTEFVRLGDISGGSTHDMGDVVLLRSGSLRVSCLGLGGPSSSHTSIRVVVRCLRFPLPTGDPTRGRYREVGRAKSLGPREFLVEDLPAGFVTVEVLRRGRGGQRIGSAFSWVLSDEETSVSTRSVEPLENGLWVEVRVESGLLVLPEADNVRIVGEETGERRAVPREGLFAFDRLRDDEVELSVVDPRFEAWSQVVPVEPGYAIVTLRGTSGLTVLARDARTREILDHVRTELRRHGPFGSSAVSITGERQGDVTLYRGIPADRWTPIVRAPGYAPMELEAFTIGPHEEHTIVALLSDGVSVAGRVRFPKDVPGPLGAAARVELYRADAYDRSPHVGLSNDPQARVRFKDALESQRIANVAAVTEPDGSFVLTDIDPGEYLVGADLGYGCIGFEPLRVLTEDYKGVDLVLPPKRRLRGALDLPASIDATRFVVTAAGVVAGETGEVADTVRVHAALDRNGRFESDPLPPGPIEVALRLDPYPSALAGDALRLPFGTSIDLGELEMPPNRDAEVDFAAFEEQRPATVTVACSVQGDEADLVVEALAVGDPTLGDGRRVDGDELELSVFAGRYRLRIRALDGSWCRWHAEPLELDPGAAQKRSFEVTLARGELMFVGLDGAPLAERELWWWRPGDDAQFAARGRTDESGRLTLTLPPGEVHFALPDEALGLTAVPGRDRVTVVFGEEGPLRDRVVLGALTDR